MKNKFSWPTIVELYISDTAWAEMIAQVMKGTSADKVIADYLAGLDDADYYAIDDRMEEDLVDYLVSLTET